MGLFDKVFGKKNNNSTPPPPPPSGGSRGGGGGGGGGGGVADSMEKLDNTVELLDKRTAVLEKKIDAEVAKAKDFLAKKNKNGAAACLKRKKMYEEQITKNQAQRDNIETMRFALQEQAMNREVLEAQRHAGQQLNQLNAGMNADRVEDDMDDIREAMDMAQDVTNALVQPIDNNPVDEDDLMDELDALANEVDGGAKVTTTNTATTLPSELTNMNVPSSNLPTKSPVMAKEEEDEEAALRALEAELAA